MNATYSTTAALRSEGLQTSYSVTVERFGNAGRFDVTFFKEGHEIHSAYVATSRDLPSVADLMAYTPDWQRPAMRRVHDFARKSIAAA